MQGEEVVDVDEVLVNQLPVAIEGLGDALVEPEPLLLVRAERFGILGDEALERLGRGVETDEHPALPHAAAHGLQPAAVEVEVLDVVHVGGADEAAGEVVGPGVVGAAERLEVAAAGRDLGAAMDAHIVEGVDLAVAVAGDDDGLADDVEGHVVPGLLELLDAGHGEPVLLEDLLLLEGEDLFGGVDGARQVVGLGEGLARSADPLADLAPLPPRPVQQICVDGHARPRRGCAPATIARGRGDRQRGR